jgi:hypothetical protein
MSNIFDLIRSFTIGSNDVNHQYMRKIVYSTERNQIKVEKSESGKLNHENDVIHDANKVICDMNHKKNRRYWEFSVILANSVIFWHWKYLSLKL